MYTTPPSLCTYLHVHYPSFTVHIPSCTLPLHHCAHTFMYTTPPSLSTYLHVHYPSFTEHIPSLLLFLHLILSVYRGSIHLQQPTLYIDVRACSQSEHTHTHNTHTHTNTHIDLLNALLYVHKQGSIVNEQ